MNALNPTVRHLTREDYQTKPWKNGKGQTQDILLIPDGADHSNFDLRFALSPIVEEAPFSSFPGADRVINVIEGDTLKLAFDGQTIRLDKYDSHRFDTGLSPVGTPLGGPIRVVNVMARRGVWDIVVCEIQSKCSLTCDDNDLLFIYAICEESAVSVDGKQSRLYESETLIATGAASVEMSSEGLFLVSKLAQVDSQ